MTEELLPCPFCGDLHILFTTDRGALKGSLPFTIICQNCKFINTGETKQELRDWWNKRISKNEWHSCKDLSPEHYKEVLVHFKTDDSLAEYTMVAYLDEDSEWNARFLYESMPIDKSKLIPVQWRELPVKPEVKE